MLHIGFARIRPDKEGRLRSWFQELAQRREEVLETFVNEGTRHEQVFIVPGEEGPILVYATEVEDTDRAIAAFRNSILEVDHQHKSVLAECLAEKLRLQPLFDLKS